MLVVEDDPVGQRITAQMVERLGYAVDVVANGHEAIDAVARIAYALVLMDGQLPDLDGYATAAEIRRQEVAHTRGSRSRVPIVALTASRDAGDRERALTAGMDAHLTKPVRAGDLAATLERWAARREDTPPADEPVRPPVLDPAGPLGTASDLSPQHREIVELFLMEVPRRLRAFEAAISHGDRNGAARLAHLLAGSADILGAARLAAACAHLEACVEGEAMPDTLQLVRTEFQHFQATLAERFPTVQPGVRLP